MNQGLPPGRTLDYFVLRVCERLRLEEAEFLSLSYAQQVRLLAYDRLRREETAAEGGR